MKYMRDNKKITDSYLISIVILSYERAQMLLELLKDMQTQSIIDRAEVIVVDNGSTDDIYSTLNKCPYIDILIRNDNNLGATARNFGIQRASSKYVVTLDDDVFFNRADELERIVRFFAVNENAHAVNFKILFPDSKEMIPFNWYHPRDPNVFQDDTFITDYISEGAVAFRKECFCKTGYYPEEFFIGQEGPDLAYRFIKNKYNIYYCGEIQVLHKCSNVQRSSWRNCYYDSRNYLWLLIRNIPFRLLPVHIIFRLFTTFAYALLRGHVKWYVKGVKDGIIGMPYHLRKRNPLSIEDIRKIKEIRKLQLGYSERIRNFIKKRKSYKEQFRTTINP